MPEWPPDSLLGVLPAAARDTLLSLGSERRAAPGGVLIREHDESKFVAIILSGIAKVTGNVAGGAEVLLAIRMAGEVVGEFAAMDQRPRSATVTACGPLVARIISGADFTACQERHPEIARAVSKAVVAKMRDANQHRIDFSVSEIPLRVTRVLFHLTMSYGKPPAAESGAIGVPVTQAELAVIAGASAPSVERTLRQLRDNGVISTGYRSITVQDAPSLRQAARLTG